VVGEFRIPPQGNFVVRTTTAPAMIEIPGGRGAAGRWRFGESCGARAVEARSNEDLDGMIVTAEILDYGTDGDRPHGAHHRVPGPSRTISDRRRILIRAHHIPHRFRRTCWRRPQKRSGSDSDAEIARRPRLPLLRYRDH